MAQRKPGRPPWRHHQLLITALYGDFTWWTRHPGGGLTAPVRQLSEALGCRSDQLADAAARLHDLELAEVQWHGTWLYLRPRVPPGMARVARLNSAADGKSDPVSPHQPQGELVWLQT